MVDGFEELADGVFRRRYAALDQNVGLVLGDAGALIIDTRSLPIHADEIVAEVARITPLPVRWVVNTHWHWDHVLGNAVFADAVIWGHTRCREVLLARPEQTVEASRASFGELAVGLTVADVVAPQEVFAAEATIDLGGRPAQLAFRGRGHTDSDVVVTVGDVLFAGDLLEDGAPPYFGDGFPTEWPETLQRHLAGDVRVAVPGHGDVMSPSAAATQLAEIRDVARRCLQADGGQIELGDAPYPPEVMQMAAARHREVG